MASEAILIVFENTQVIWDAFTVQREETQFSSQPYIVCLIQQYIEQQLSYTTSVLSYTLQIRINNNSNIVGVL